MMSGGWWFALNVGLPYVLEGCEFLGVPGNGRRIEFRDGLISRENVWLDGGNIVQQLTAPEAVSALA